MRSSDSSTISLRGGTRELLFEFLQPPRHTEAEISAIDAAAKWPVTPGTQLMMDNRSAGYSPLSSRLGLQDE